METIFGKAITALGGATKAAAIVKRSQPTISGYANDRQSLPPAEVCMRIEVATKGEYPAAALRPDLAEIFSAFRDVPVLNSRPATKDELRALNMPSKSSRKRKARAA